MKYIFAGDIHGSAYYCEKLLETITVKKPDKIILLGDLLYHGPRNDLPRDYAPKQVIAMLNSVSDIICCVRGNCEAEVDQMVLDFPCMADYALILLDNGKTAFVTHGHLFGKDKPPKLNDGDYLICGHTHIKAYEKVENFTYINPGSISIPKDDERHCCYFYENGIFNLLDI